MTTANPVTDNEFILRMRATEREALRKAKTKAGLTYTQVIFEILEGTRKPLKPRASSRKGKPISWNGVKIYTTDDQADFLLAAAERRGTTVSKAVRAAIFIPDLAAMATVKEKPLRLTSSVPQSVRDDLAVLLDGGEFPDFKEWSESRAFVEIAGILIHREALVRP